MNYYKNLLILFKALIDEHGVKLGMPFFEVNGRMADLQISGNSKDIFLKYRNKNYDLVETKENDDTRALLMECDPTDWGLGSAILFPEEGPKQ